MSKNPSDNRPSKAVALKYEGGKRAPTVVAKGDGLLAEKIIELAQQHDVPLYEDADLLLLLANVELDDTIPEELFKAVAEVLAFVYSLKKKMPVIKV